MNNSRQTIISFIGILSLMLLAGCAQKGPAADQQLGRDRVYKGTLLLDADAGLESIVKQELEVFEYFHDSVQIPVSYKTEIEMLEDFRSKKASTLILSRMLSEAEKQSLKERDTIYVRELPVAYDAVALIGNKQYDDSKLDIAALKHYFDPQTGAGVSGQMVFDGSGASSVKYVLDVLGYKEKISPNVHAVKSADELVDYVEKDKTAIGFIPYNFLSDTDDERVKKILEKIKVLSLRAKSQKGEEIRVSANQSDIAEGVYPLTRTINTVSHFNTDDNLDWLLVNFLSKEKGAKIFLKAGLIPVLMPEREIKVNTEGLKGGN